MNKKYQVATVLSSPHIHPFYNKHKKLHDLHLAYDAETFDHNQLVVMTSSIDNTYIGEPVMLEYHFGMDCYQHYKHFTVSNEHNCSGGFYYLNGKSAE